MPAPFDGVTDPEGRARGCADDFARQARRLAHHRQPRRLHSANLGGLQAAIQREAVRLAERRRDHLHLYPAGPWPVVRTASDREGLGVVWNGEGAGDFRAGGHRPSPGPSRPGTDASAPQLRHPQPAGPCAGRKSRDILAAAGLSQGVFWLHDFASLCAGFHLLRNDVEDCGRAAPPAAPPAASASMGRGGDRHLDALLPALFERLQLTVAAPSQVTLDLWRASTRLPARRRRRGVAARDAGGPRGQRPRRPSTVRSPSPMRACR